MDEVLRDIGIERLSQIQLNGFDAVHDDQHQAGEIAAAAGLIAADTADGFMLISPGTTWMDDLADKVERKHGDNPRQRLVIAGALIVAEIDRLDRLKAAQDAVADEIIQGLLAEKKSTNGG